MKEGFLMEDQKKWFISWVKAHKKELIIAGISIATIIGIIVAIQNKNKILELWESLRKCTKNPQVKVPTASGKVVESISQQSAHVIEVVPTWEIIKFPATVLYEQSNFFP